MRKNIFTSPEYRLRMHDDTVEYIINQLQVTCFNPKYFLTIEYAFPHRNIQETIPDVHHLDQTIDSFIHRNKFHTDTPGRIYFTEPNASHGFHTHIIMEQLPLKTINYYADKIFLSSPETEEDPIDRENRVIEELGAHLKKYVKKMCKSKDGFHHQPFYGIDGLVTYVNKSFFDWRVKGSDHVDFMNGSIFNPQWIQNRLNTLTGAN